MAIAAALVVEHRCIAPAKFGDDQARHVVAHVAPLPHWELDVLVEQKVVGEIGQAALVGDELAVIFAHVGGVRGVHQTAGNRRERRAIEQRSLLLGHRRLVGNQVARIVEAELLRDAAKIVDVHGAAQAERDVVDVVGDFPLHATIGEHIGEIPLAAFPQNAPHLCNTARLIRGFVERAVRNDHIDAAVGNKREILRATSVEFHVGGIVAELLHLLFQILLADAHADGVRLDADYLARRPHELRREVGVAARAAAQIDHRAAFQKRRQGHAELPRRVLDLARNVEHALASLPRNGSVRVSRAGGRLRIARLGSGDCVVVCLIVAVFDFAIVCLVVHATSSVSILRISKDTCFDLILDVVYHFTRKLCPLKRF